MGHGVGLSLLSLEVSHIDLKHGADESIAYRPNVAPSRIEGLLNKWPQLKDEINPHEQVLP
jgi:hypothetical protein